MEFIFTFILPLIAVYCFFVYYDSKKKQEQDVVYQSYTDSILTDNNFKATKSFTSSNNKYSIYYDNEREQILVITDPNSNTPYVKTFVNPKDIIECSLYEDDATVTKTSRGSQLGGALVGGVLAGGVGAVVGGLSGKKTSTGATKIIELRITLDNPLNPLLKVRFLDEYSPVKKDNYKYEKAMNEAIEWQNLVAVLIHRAEKEVN